MIFGRKKNTDTAAKDSVTGDDAAASADDTTVDAVTDPHESAEDQVDEFTDGELRDESARNELVDGPAQNEEAAEPEEPVDEESPDEELADEEPDELDEWAILDQGDYRDEGPFDISEVDLADDPVKRVDLGALILTPFSGAELRLNVLENTRKVVSVLMVQGDSALDISVFAAPSSGGLWAETRTRLIAETEQAGGTVKLTEGPFGTELRRLLPAKGPNGEAGYQPTRTWMAQGPRWALRGVLYGKAALSEALDENPVAPFFDAFRDVIVRRGDSPQRSGEVLAMNLPEGAQVKPRTTAGAGGSTAG